MTPDARPSTGGAIVRAAGARLRVLWPLAAGSLLLAACAPSSGALSNAVGDEPGVVRVEVDESGGDDGLPFASVPKFVTVQMEADASQAEIMAVFDAYDDTIADGDVVAVEVTLNGSKQATLSTGEGVHATPGMVEELVDAQHDAAVVEYRREAHPVLPSVRLVLDQADFEDVVRVADRYRDAEDIESVTVLSGDFLLIRDEVNEDLRITATREQVVAKVAAQFPLRGAVVTGRGPLELIVAPADKAAVRRLAERIASGPAGKIVVGTSRSETS